METVEPGRGVERRERGSWAVESMRAGRVKRTTTCAKIAATEIRATHKICKKREMGILRYECEIENLSDSQREGERGEGTVQSWHSGAARAKSGLG